MNYASLVSGLGIQGQIQGNEFRAHCPFHQDRSPSFSLNLTTGMSICFRGCFKGTFPQLVERTLGCSFQEAHEWIAQNGRRTSVEGLAVDLEQKLGYQYTDLWKQEPAYQEEHWRTLYERLDNKVMPQWFLDRGFTWETIQRWEIRYDVLRDGVVVPVRWLGNLVGTITRQGKGIPKYLNSPGLPKSEMLFGEIYGREDRIIICEGVLDTLWLNQNGYNAAGLLGSYMSQTQVEILQKYRFGEVVLALDNDEAGRKGTKETVKRLIGQGWMYPQIKVIEFPDNKKDVQDCSAEELRILYGSRKDILSGQLLA